MHEACGIQDSEGPPPPLHRRSHQLLFEDACNEVEFSSSRVRARWVAVDDVPQVNHTPQWLLVLLQLLLQLLLRWVGVTAGIAAAAAGGGAVAEATQRRQRGAQLGRHLSVGLPPALGVAVRQVGVLCVCYDAEAK